MVAIVKILFFLASSSPTLLSSRCFQSSPRGSLLSLSFASQAFFLPNLSISPTSTPVLQNFRRTARAVTRLYDLGLEPSGLRATQFAILTAIAKFQPVSISRIGEILVLDQTTLTRSLRLQTGIDVLPEFRRYLQREKQE